MVGLPRTEQAVARSLAETADPRDALTRALRTIADGLGWRVGAVWEPATDRPEALRCVELWHAVDADAEDFERELGFDRRVEDYARPRVAAA